MNRLKTFYHYYFAKAFYTFIKPLQPILRLKRRTFYGKFKVRNKDGVTFLLYNNAFNLETKLFWSGFEKSSWERKSREFWKELSKKSKIIFDIGANTGIYSILSKAYNPEAMVFAFEPQPNVFNVLEKNNLINAYDILCYQLALSNESGELPFYNTGYSTFDSNNTTHGSLNKEWRTEHQHSIVVNVDRLDHFIRENGIGKIDLIKIDVETLEFEVLEGYGEFLYMHRPIIILEIQNEEIGEKLSALFRSRDYQFFWINENEGLVSVTSLGGMTIVDNWNYCLCPVEKLEEIKSWL